MTFSNGDKLDADDVAWSINELIAKGYHDADALAAVSKVEAKDADTAVITLKTPNSNLLWTLTGRAGLVFDKDAKYDLKTQAVGSGPYTVAKFVENSSITLKANEKYWGKNKAKTPTVVVKYLADDNAAVNALKSGDVQVLAPITENLAEPFKSDSAKYTVKAGNGTDVTARILAQYAEKYVGQTIVIENVDGGSGSIGWSQIAAAAPDGMTIGFMNLPNFNSSIVKELGTYTTADFAAICNHVTETSLVLVRADDERFNDIDDLVAYAKENQTVASTNGAQASNHIGAQAFANSAGFKYIDLPQGNTADELTSLLGKEADWCVAKAADIAGRTDVKPLAVFSTERIFEFPDVPTLGEKGYYDQWLGSSRCVVAPAGVSPEVIAFYEAAFKATMEDPDYLAAAASFATDYKDAAATAALIEQQQEFTESLATGFWYE